MVAKERLRALAAVDAHVATVRTVGAAAAGSSTELSSARERCLPFAPGVGIIVLQAGPAFRNHDAFGMFQSGGSRTSSAGRIRLTMALNS